MGNAIMGTGQATGEDRATKAAEDALRNPLLGEVSIKSAKGMLVNITGGSDMTLFEVDKAAQRVTQVGTEDRGKRAAFRRGGGGATFVVSVGHP
jgi:cell division protein FtsZ